MKHSPIKKLVDTYLSEILSFQPLWGTSLGISGYDTLLGNFSEERIGDHLQNLKRINVTLHKTSKNSSNSIDFIERSLFENDLKMRIIEWEEWKRYRRDPSFYVGELIYGLWYSVFRISSPADRAESLIQRMLQAPRMLEVAKRNLKNPPRLWVQITLQEVQGYLSFLKEIEQELRRIAPRRLAEIHKALQIAETTGKGFVKLLQEILQRAKKGGYAVGEKKYNYLLKHYHYYSWDADQLEKIGRQAFQEIQQALKEQARKIDKKIPWHRLVEELKKDHTTAKKLLPRYREETKRLRRFIRDHQIVDIPSGEKLHIIDTPTFARSTIPFAAYMDPPMFGGKGEGNFFVTPIPKTNPKKQEELLQEHNEAALKVTALHEGYPGHHLQFIKQREAKGTMMKIFNCSSFFEGWALYCEEMMGEEGYYDDRTKLFQLKDKLWRACRVIVDVGLQTGEMNDDEAVSWMAKELKMSKHSARADVNWYTMRATVPQGYYSGMLLIRQLREKYKKKLGNRFTLKKFHEELLQFGAIPIPLIAKVILA